MRYVKPAIFTVCVGNAFGEAAMLLAAGEKVCVVLCVVVVIAILYRQSACVHDHGNILSS